ncbi:MAG: hypothetical protein MUD14_22595 [Hydrococcus sp. Prado102]|jgi:hypothetical protein|nr:hypothetical protein [Hydrococcus sp. Prado102]
MIISDLNYLEVVNQETGIVRGGGVKFDSNIKKKKDIKVDIKINIDKNVKAKADFKGNFSFVEGVTDAKGKNTFTEIEGGTQTEEGKLSQGFLESVAVSY